MVLIGQILRALSPLGNSALLIKLVRAELRNKGRLSSCFHYCSSISHFENAFQADFHKHFKFALTISDLAKCLF